MVKINEKVDFGMAVMGDRALSGAFTTLQKWVYPTERGIRRWYKSVFFCLKTYRFLSRKNTLFRVMTFPVGVLTDFLDDVQSCAAVVNTLRHFITIFDTFEALLSPFRTVINGHIC